VLPLTRGIIITHQPEKVVHHFRLQQGNHTLTLIDTEGKEFLLADADRAIAKAYVASEVMDFILLVAPRFSVVAQNRLLKIIEEPPRNKQFILITASKASLLPTIQSRLPITLLNDAPNEDDLRLDLLNLNLAHVYAFLQEHKRLGLRECQTMVERIVLEAIKSNAYILDRATLKLFTDSIKALELGSPSSFVLNTVLLKLLEQKRK